MTDKHAYAGDDLSNPDASFSVRGKETVAQAGTDRGGLAGATQQKMDEVNKLADTADVNAVDKLAGDVNFQQEAANAQNNRDAADNNMRSAAEKLKQDVLGDNPSAASNRAT